MPDTFALLSSLGKEIFGIFSEETKNLKWYLLKVLLVVGTIRSDNYEMKTLCNHSFMNAIILPTLLNGLCEEY